VLFEILTLHPHAKSTERRPSRRTPDREIPPELDELCVLDVAASREGRRPTGISASAARTRVSDCADAKLESGWGDSST
jgi:hypothetical protein